LLPLLPPLLGSLVHDDQQQQAPKMTIQNTALQVQLNTKAEAGSWPLWKKAAAAPVHNVPVRRLLPLLL